MPGILVIVMLGVGLSAGAVQAQAPSRPVIDGLTVAPGVSAYIGDLDGNPNRNFIQYFASSKFSLMVAADRRYGNVAEWCQDTFHPSYQNLTDFNPLHVDPDETRRVVRGGSWASDAFYIGVGVRDAAPADEASPYIGFRCVMDISAAGE